MTDTMAIVSLRLLSRLSVILVSEATAQPRFLPNSCDNDNGTFTENSTNHNNLNSTEDLLSFVWRNWRERTASSFVDPTITNNSRNEIMRSSHTGILGVQENITDRPTMALVALMLNSYFVPLPVPSEPTLSINSRNLSDSQSGEHNSVATRANQFVQASANEAC